MARSTPPELPDDSEAVDSGLLASLDAVLAKLEELIGLPPESLQRTKGLDRALVAPLIEVNEQLLSPRSRVFLRRLRRSVSDLDSLDKEERVSRLRRTRDAVAARIRRGDDPEAEEVAAPRRQSDAPERDTVSDAAVAIGELRGVGPVKRDALATIGIHTVADLLHHLPRKYQDRTSATPIAELEPGTDAVVFGTIAGVRSGRGRRMRFVEIAVEDGSGSLLATWFRPSPWIRQAFSEQDEVCLMGKVERKAPPLRMNHPEFEGAGSRSGEGVHRGIVVPLYTLPQGLGQRSLRALMFRAFEDFAEGLPDRLPAGLREELDLPSRAEALRTLHFAQEASELPALRDGRHPAHEALLLEDLFVLQVALLRRRVELGARGCAVPDPVDGPSLRERLIAALPFELTGAQKRVLAELGGDLRSGSPMQRMLQGDVGAGKTVVALLAAADLVESGVQVAVLAPTEVLAWQWWERARELYGTAGVEVALLTGGQRAAARRHNRKLTEEGTAGLVVGTHAVFQEGVSFAELGMAVVDEQHRFGVFQRARLLAKGQEPHLLAMTATPIPRSLALTIYGDLDLSVLDERPPRGLLQTELLPLSRRAEAWELVREAAQAGERAYVICPRVEGVGNGHAVVETAESLVAGPLQGVRVGIVHGKMDAASKDAAIERFRSGELAVLVGTTVVEVGVDVPEATVMVVLDADRFGLAQLHQLRGRVGRSERGGRCLLVTESGSDKERLRILESTIDGFAIAEADLRLRGPGDLVGARQSGAPAFRLSTSPRFVELLAAARSSARDTASRADYASSEQLAALRAAVEVRLETSSVAEAG